jgi:methylmalonyl-CoA/ethylmalonyl-CoA epimerase
LSSINIEQKRVPTLKFSHIGVAVPNIEAAVITYCDLFDYRECSGPFNDPIQHVSVCFLAKGGLTIELVAPQGKHSPVNKILAKGIGAYHTCYEVEDIDEALEFVRAKGCIVVSKPVTAVAFEGRRIAWFYTPTHQLVELVEQS